MIMTNFVNSIVVVLTCMWLAVAAIVSWVGCALVGFIFAFSQYPWVKDVTPLIGLTIVICIIKCIGKVWDSDPIAYFTAKYKWLESKLVKEKIQL